MSGTVIKNQIVSIWNRYILLRMCSERTMIQPALHVLRANAAASSAIIKDAVISDDSNIAGTEFRS